MTYFIVLLFIFLRYFFLTLFFLYCEQLLRGSITLLYVPQCQILSKSLNVHDMEKCVRTDRSADYVFIS
jgi:hypothetical protein